MLRPNGILRKKNYKAAVHTEEARRKREDDLVEIRKNKREENLQKKRKEGMPAPSSEQADLALPIEPKWEPEPMPDLVRAIMSEDLQVQCNAATQIRKMLSVEENPPIEKVVEAGVVPRLVELLRRAGAPKLQFEASWALTNIASGTTEQTRLLINLGAVPIFVDLLRSVNDDVQEQAVWALGNIAGDSPKFRDLVLGHGAMTELLPHLNEGAKLSMLRNAMWTLSNFCRGKPQPQFDLVKIAIPVLARLIQMNDTEVLIDACWALSHLSDGSNDKIQAVVEAGICPRLVELLVRSPTVIVPALRTVGNIATGDDEQTQVLLDSNVLPRLLSLVTISYKKSIKREACWTISNITAGNRSQIQAVIDADIFPQLIFVLGEGEFDLKKEAAWAVSNAISGGSDEQIRYLVSIGCIKPICDLLSCPDPRIIEICLDGLQNILTVGEEDKNEGITTGINLFAQIIEDAGGLDKIEQLQTHHNPAIYDKAVKILVTYLSEDNDEDYEPWVNSDFGFAG